MIFFAWSAMSGFVSFNCIKLCSIHIPPLYLNALPIMSEMTKEELEFEINILSENIKVLIILGHEVGEYRNKLTEYREKLLLLTRAESNANQAE